MPWYTILRASAIFYLKLSIFTSVSFLLQLALWGETPETALSSAMHSVNFFMQEQEQQHSTAQAALTRKIERVHEQCKQKLQQVHNGYVTVSSTVQQLAYQVLVAFCWLHSSHHFVLRHFPGKEKVSRGGGSKGCAGSRKCGAAAEIHSEVWVSFPQYAPLVLGLLGLDTFLGLNTFQYWI